MKIIITGARGFIGGNLIEFLSEERSHQVVKLAKENILSINNRYLEDTDVIVHLAGKAHDLKKNSDPQEYYEGNFKPCKVLYDSFLCSNAKKFVFISSVKAVADTVEDILTEEVISNPQTDYGKSKLLAEEYIVNQPLPTGKSYYILRPCMVHGPGNKGNLSLLYKFIKSGIPYPLAGFKNRRSFLSVKNLCFVINELVTRNDIQSGIYNVADDDPISTNEVVNVLSTSLNTKPKLWAINVGVIRFFAKIGDMLHLPLTTERLNKLTESYIVSNQKIKKAIGKKLPLSALEGLQITADSFKKI